MAGTATLTRHDEDATPGAEIGWLVLPEYQGQGLAR
ncbi:GNAT family N-acetyltransferase [Micromonospora sp. WMMD882]